ncbi:hypothetical protein LSH36_443g04065 [Paralvinella palmiformis]|uniref:Uncharacterized protein n=1 Tax=Paralvinella palmiformis TaxID=53620 RepID=A0AAD9JBD0_9ANNE|nr:hypothetical protein LSH36_443g04065 [Paralvinella palmiformis]
MLSRAPGPSTIANTVTTHACNIPSDDPANLHDTNPEIVTATAWHEKDRVSNHLNIFSFRVPFAFEKSTGRQEKECDERLPMMQIPKLMSVFSDDCNDDAE